jgi:hypothetical protein
MTNDQREAIAKLLASVRWAIKHNELTKGEIVQAILDDKDEPASSAGAQALSGE